MQNNSNVPARRRILCVEDNQDTCEVLSFIFREYELVFAGAISDAASHVEDENFDLYILDNWLPDGSGVELCRRIRGRWPMRPIVFTSAAGMPDSVREAVEAGANKYMLKPIEPDQLKNVVKNLLEEV